MKFEITPNQEDLINKWHNDIKRSILREKKKSLDPDSPASDVYYGAIGGGLSYIFTPTSIGTALTVVENITGEEIDVTDWDTW